MPARSPVRLFVRAPARAALLVALAVSALFGFVVQAQAPGDSTRAVIRRLSSDLRNLVTAQEQHFADRGRYAAAISEIPERAYRSAGTTVEIVAGGTNGYGAIARSAGYAGSCVIHINVAEAQAPRTALEKKSFPEGEPACDGDGETEAAHWVRAAQWNVTSVLSRMAKLQERHFGKTGAYATDVAQLEGYRAIPEITLTLETTPEGGRGQGFYLTGRHARYPSASCVLRSGFGPWLRQAVTAADKRAPSADLQVACDDFR